MTQKKKIEDYMKIIFQLDSEGVARGAYIAERLGVSKPTVSVTLKELEKEGFIRTLENRTLKLTEKGAEIAEKVIERNQIIYELLVNLGVDRQTATDDACRMEHSISQESIDALVKLTNYLKFIRQSPFAADV